MNDGYSDEIVNGQSTLNVEFIACLGRNRLDLHVAPRFQFVSSAIGRKTRRNFAHRYLVIITSQIHDNAEPVSDESGASLSAEVDRRSASEGYCYVPSQSFFITFCPQKQSPVPGLDSLVKHRWNVSKYSRTKYAR